MLFLFSVRLDLLFYQFDVKAPMASVVFWHKLEMSVQYGLGSQLSIDIKKVTWLFLMNIMIVILIIYWFIFILFLQLKKWMDNWSFTVDERRRVFKLVWELYKPTEKKRLS